MAKASLFISLMFMGALVLSVQLSAFVEDVFKTSQGDLKITCIGHGSVMFAFAGKIIHVDPVSLAADYSRFPKADLILVTHEHGDHLDLATIESLRKPTTEIVVTEKCAGKVPKAVVMKNAETRTFQGLKVETVPAYNIVNMRGPGVAYHPKGDGNGYVITFGDRRVYVAGDTENTPEMKQLKNIDVAFLPMNLPYTMSPEMVADAARAFRPKVLFPYHYGNTEPSQLVELLKDRKDIEIRIRNMK